MSDTTRRHRPHGLTLEQAFRYWIPEEPPEPGVIWPWRGPVHPRGYGQFCHDYRMMKAHRVSYEIFCGPIPDGMVIRHVNDTPIDVNPWNLLVGTQADNMADRVTRSRQPRGQGHYATKLTEDDVREMRLLHLTGEWTTVALGQRFGISRKSASDIVHRNRWKHV